MPNMEATCAVCGHCYGDHSAHNACPVILHGKHCHFEVDKKVTPIEYNHMVQGYIDGEWREYMCKSDADAEALKSVLHRASIPVSIN